MTSAPEALLVPGATAVIRPLVTVTVTGPVNLSEAPSNMCAAWMRVTFDGAGACCGACAWIEAEKRMAANRAIDGRTKVWSPRVRSQRVRCASEHNAKCGWDEKELEASKTKKAPYGAFFVCRRCLALDVEVLHVEGVFFDELAASFDVFAHERGEDLFGGGDVLQLDLQECAAGGIHRGLPELRGGHLAEALVALD